jgi:16S rRNA (cytosine1402-N4)-methyltransferase
VSGDTGHVPVLAEEVFELLAAGKTGPFKLVDGTVGLGGHSSLILRRNAAAESLGIDRDEEALTRAENVLSFAAERARLVKDEFSSLAERAIGFGWHLVDAVLLDIGVSSIQIDTPSRGFSIRNDGPLDMRMDKTSSETAARVLNNSRERELAAIFREGGVKKSRVLARAIVERAKEKPWSRTKELVELCEKVLGGRERRRSIPPATLCFQALRMRVNDELGELKKALPEAVRILKPGGRLAVISFHSLEDGVVKRFMKKESAECLCPPGLPACVCGHVPSLKILTRKPVTASEEEIARNPRAASAKLRVAEKLPSIEDNGKSEIIITRGARLAAERRFHETSNDN